jgi:diadenylate cyclase
MIRRVGWARCCANRHPVESAFMTEREVDNVKPAQGSPGDYARRITRSVLMHVEGLAQEAGASAVFIYADALADKASVLPEELTGKAVYVSRTGQTQADIEQAGHRCLRVPNVPLTRIGQIKVAIFLALSRDIVRPGDVIVFLAGIAESATLDTIMITQVGREFEMYSAAERGDELPTGVRADVLERVLDLAAELGNEGREGKPVGALFVVGDAENVIGMSRQLILNPFRGYEENERNLLDPALEETIKELSTIDGAFIIRGDGIVETCGAYLKTATQDEFELPRGLGARHHAAAAIASLTDAIAITVSESTGTVTIFRQGKPITEIEKPRSTARQRSRFLSGDSGSA